MESLREFAEFEARQARHIFEVQGNLRMMFIGQRADGVRVPLMVPFVSPETKDDLAAALRKLFAEMGVVRYAMLSEVWMLKGDAAKDSPPYELPSESPHRIEAVTVGAHDTGPDAVMVVMEIKRDADGNGTLEPDEIIECQSAGRFADLLIANRTEH